MSSNGSVPPPLCGSHRSKLDAVGWFPETGYDAGRKAEARSELALACRLAPTDARSLVALARVEKDDANLSAARELLERAVAAEPQQADARYVLGQVMLQQGDREGALSQWKAAIKANPDRTDILYRLFQSLSDDRPREAAAYRDRFLALREQAQIADRVHALNNFAIGDGSRANWQGAIAQLTEAVLLCGNCPDGATLHKNLGLMYARSGDKASAVQELNIALKLDPENVDARRAMVVLQPAHAPGP